MNTAVEARPTNWSTGWTAESPLNLDYAFSRAAEAVWQTGPFPGFQQRELGLVNSSKGLMGGRHLRVKGTAVDAAADWRCHDVDFQFWYVLKGTAQLENDRGQTIDLRPGTVAIQPAFLRYKIDQVSPDFEMIEIIAPAEPKTYLGRNASLPAKANEFAVKLPTYQQETAESYVLGMGPRKFFRYRDLGTSDPTDGRIYLHIVRAVEPKAGGTGWHTHSMRQWFWVIGGSAGFEVEGDPAVKTVELYDACCVPQRLRHDVPSFTANYAVLEMCIPTEYDTVDAIAPT